ncbi:MAG: hypothetical protein II921_06570 [Treponema sp.]|nr:hypothetical protein [Treponema sp.]
MKKSILIFTSLFFAISACSSESSGSTASSSGAQNSAQGGSSSYSGAYATETEGYVTWYDGADASSVAYYAPELESGWYHCAVSEPKLSDIPPGSAIELSANGKTVHLVVTDLCPSSSNAAHTSKANYFFDLEKSAFTTLADASVGELNMTFKIIPYPTTKNITFLAKDGTNDWWLSGKFYNVRYALKKVEYSADGSLFSEMKPLSGTENNWYVIASGTNLTKKLYFRLTDVCENVVTTNALTNISADASYDTGVNFGE